MKTVAGIFSIVCIGFGLTGCGATSATDGGQPSDEGRQYILAEKPSGAIAVAAAKERAANPGEFVLLGHIDAGDVEPWEEGRASFYITDATITDHHHHADGHECAFCNGKKDPLETMAVVQILDGDGKVLAIDARKLLGLRKNQLVAVRGRGEVDDLGQLSVTASGIYVQR